MQAIRRGALALALLLAAALPAGAQPTETEARVVRTGTANEDLYLAGSSVQMAATVNGDVVAAGGSVKVDGDVTGNVIVAGGHVEVSRRVGQDLMAAGGNVEVGGRVEDDVRATGGTVVVRAAVGGDLVGAGGDFTLETGGSVAGRAWLAGGNVSVDGSVGRELRVRADTARLSGAVRGDVMVEARELIVAPTARISGRLSYTSPEEAQIDPAAQIAGGVERLPMPPGREYGAWSWAGAVLAGVGGLLSLFVTATVLRFVFPGASVQAARTLGTSPWKSLGLGFALFFCIPAAAIVLFVTAIGVPLGLALLLLIYPLALGLGVYVTAVQIAEWLGGRLFGRGRVPGVWQVGVLWLAVLLLVGVGLIPWLGQLAQFAALLFGLGALSLHLWARYRGGTVPMGR